MTSDKSRSVDLFRMLPNLSSLADKSSVLYEGRAKISHLEDIEGMIDSGWRARLIAVIEQNGRSMRDVSRAAGKGDGYVFSILKEGKDPTIDNLIAVCQALDVSLTKILFGIEVSPETEEILSLIEENPASRDGILQILRAKGKT